jgi:hypothetical protein
VDHLLAKYIAQAERRYGSRVSGWTIAPVIVDRDNFAETLVDRTARRVEVHITNSTRKYPTQAIYQLAHEAVHCFVASGRRDTIYFEEGLANDFALTLPDLPALYRNQALATLPTLLREPLSAFRALNATDEAIRALRAVQPDFDALTPDIIVNSFGVSPQTASDVCKRMPHERPFTM